MLSEPKFHNIAVIARGLNPCCNGICSRRADNITNIITKIDVSILVVMEYALGAITILKYVAYVMVSILVVMEYALGVFLCDQFISYYLVSILVVMEYALGASRSFSKKVNCNCLNPCCNGICSRRRVKRALFSEEYSLNPCCNGICSRRLLLSISNEGGARLNPCCNGICSRRLYTSPFATDQTKSQSLL